MEFIAEIADRKTIQKLDIGINQFLIENNVSQIEKILNFFKSNNRLLLVNGFMGTGKTMVVNQALSMLNEDVITLKYNCFETTILDDILLEFFDDFKRLTVQNIIKAPKTKTENFTQKINAYFESIDKPTIIVINSFEQILKENKTEILNFLNYISKYEKIKTILIARKFEYDDFKSEYEKVSISAFEKGIFEANLGITPNNDGESIRIIIPPLTEERRIELTKQAKAIAEEGKVAIRNIRRDIIEEIEKEKLPEDVEKSKTNQVQDLVNEYNKLIDEKLKEKEEELLSV